LVGVAAWVSAGSAAAEDDATRAAGRKLAEDGVAALQAGDASTASQKLDKAHAILKVPSVALWSARALEKRKLLVEAAERLREAARLPISGDPAVQAQAKHDAEQELAELSTRIPTLIVKVSEAAGDPVAVTLDGVELPSALLGEERPVNPGRHVVLARRQAQAARAEVDVAEAEHKTLVLELEAQAGVTPLAKSAPSTKPSRAEPLNAEPDRNDSVRRTWAYVALGTGAAGLLVGGVSGGLAIGKKSSLDANDACSHDVCTREAEDDVHALRTFRTLSSVGFAVGGVLAATGAVLWLTSSPSRETPRAQHVRTQLALGVGPGFVRVMGGF
jgi:hypothetical protein